MRNQNIQVAFSLFILFASFFFDFICVRLLSKTRSIIQCIADASSCPFFIFSFFFSVFLTHTVIMVLYFPSQQFRGMINH